MSILPADVHPLVRGWLHGNCVALSGRDGGPPALLDTGYHTGVDALVAHFKAATGRSIADVEGIGLTHIHSDHAGGVAALRQQTRAPVFGHEDARALVADWDPRALWLTGTAQEMPRFTIDSALTHGDEVSLGGRRWRILWTPGHAVGGVSWWCERDGLLVTGDALWEHGFGLLNPWIDGPGVFALTDTALTHLSEIAHAVRVVIPGHGAPFTDVTAALGRARSRLAYLRASPDRLRRQVLFNLAAFATLARPELDRAAMRAHVLEAARVFVPQDGGSSVSDEAVCDEILRALP